VKVHILLRYGKENNMPRFGVELARDFEKGISIELARTISNAIANINVKNIEKEVRSRAITNIKATKTYQSLTNEDGLLVKHFGLEDYHTKLEEILTYISNTISIRFTKPRRRNQNKLLANAVIVEILKGGVLQLLDLDAALQETQKGEILPWLDWLLTKGESIIISNFFIKLGNYPMSRSGGAVMIEEKDSSWKVPIQYTGTPRNNFITEALSGLDDLAHELSLAEINRVI
jgi:hypothetical protein